MRYEDEGQVMQAEASFEYTQDEHAGSQLEAVHQLGVLAAKANPELQDRQLYG